MAQTKLLSVVTGDRDTLAAGDAARDQRDWAAAAAHYQRHLNARPGHFAIWVQLGHALKETGQPVEALVAYSRALALNEADADLLLNLGHLHKLMGHRALAIEYYQRSARVDSNIHARDELAQFGLTPIPAAAQDAPAPGAKSRSGQPSLSPAAARLRALAHRKSHKLRLLANQARDRLDWPTAAEQYRLYLKARPNDFAIWVQLGHALKESGQLHEALGAYGQAFSLDPHDADLLLHLGGLHEVMGHQATADNLSRHQAAPLGDQGWDVEHEIDLVRRTTLFDAQWYRATYPDVAGETDLAAHYVTKGVAQEYNPSPLFDTHAYLWEYEDVQHSGMNPLAHYVAYGEAEGRNATPGYEILYRAEASSIECLKAVANSREVALVVTHSPDGRIREHVKYYLRKLIENNISPVLIVTSNAPFHDADDIIVKEIGGLYIRANEGFDFAAWAHVLTLNPQLRNCDILYVTNDSLIGPINDSDFTAAIERIRISDADVIGLLESYEFNWHFQSFFVCFKKTALESNTFSDYFGNVLLYDDKLLVINTYELTLAPAFEKAGFTCRSLFPSPEKKPLNRTIKEWRELISEGYPFIKVTTLRDKHDGVDIEDWEAVLSAHGFDTAIAKRAIEDGKIAGAHAPPRQKSPRFAVRRPLGGKKDPFSPAFYLALYPDVAAAGAEPRHHYVHHGRREGRLGSLPGSEALEALTHSRSVKDNVIVVSHEGGRSGCPVLSYNIIIELQRKYNVIALFLGAGPLMDACRDIGATVVGPITLANAPLLAEAVISQICEAAPIKFAIVNSVESRHVLPALASRYVPSIALIHEFPIYIRPKTAIAEAAQWASQTVFSAPIVQQAAIAAHPELEWRDHPILPQGRCHVPQSTIHSLSRANDEAARLKRMMRPEGFPDEGIVVIGLGMVEMRKGVEIFIECAAKAVSQAPDLPLRFVWIGRGFDPNNDVHYSAYINDQINRSDLAGKIIFAGETTSVQTAYTLADLFLLSSRLDPLPNVCIDALDSGLPVLCFDGTSGIADILKVEHLGDDLVAPYLDVDAMAARIITLAKSKPSRQRVSQQCSRVAARTFSMARYVEQLEHMAISAADRARQEERDVEIISRNKGIKLDYYYADRQLGKRDLKLVTKDYVRSWNSGIGMRKPQPGFHPGIYLDEHGVKTQFADPYADYLSAGKPEGPWKLPLITSRDQPKPIPPNLRVGLHIHAYYPDILPEILHRLSQNATRPDLWISVPHENARESVERIAPSYCGKLSVATLPNRGRDVGPLLSWFAAEHADRYDIIGHLHTKKTVDIADPSIGRRWYRFILENLVGGESHMADIIFGHMAANPDVGLVLPDDPHVIGWDRNKPFVENYIKAMGISQLPRHLNFPAGTMFWARPQALQPLFDLKLDWADYPMEPLPYDGSMLHGLERLLGVVTEHAGYRLAATYTRGLTR